MNTCLPSASPASGSDEIECCKQMLQPKIPIDDWYGREVALEASILFETVALV